MPEIPWDHVGALASDLLLPALGASVALMALIRWPGRERLAPVAAGVALVVGAVAGNHFREILPWEFDQDRPLVASDFRDALAWSLEPKPEPKESEDAEPKESEAPEEIPVPKPRHWVLWGVFLAVLVECLASVPRAPLALAGAARALTAPRRSPGSCRAAGESIDPKSKSWLPIASAVYPIAL